jgi:threonine/homoserine/homoserine lactone efflux protein
MIGLVGGVFVGSVLWWFMLVVVSGIVRDRLSDQWLHSFNRLSGIGLLLFGAYVLFEAFHWAIQ